MKNKIKELAEQAGLHDFVFEAMGIDEEFEKFAELIVKECSRWIKSQDEADHPTAWLLCDELEKHFGVKS